MTAFDLAVVGAAGSVALASWAALAVRRARSLRARRAKATAGRGVLSRFTASALDLESQGAILPGAGDVLRQLFGCSNVVFFERAGDDDWEAHAADGTLIASPSSASRSAFGWFRYNPLIAVEADLAQRRFGAMRAPLLEVMARSGTDLLIPLVERARVLAIVGLRLGRVPDETDRELLTLFRLQLTATCANARLHLDVARVLTMAKELDLAGAVKMALAPDVPDGAVGSFEWAGHDGAGGDVGSDFWAVYPVSASQVMIVVGDAVDRGLGGTMVSAVVKSCCDAVFDGDRPAPTPAELLSVLNAALYRPGTRPAHATGIAILFQADERRVTYANAGMPAPYRMRVEDDRIVLGALPGSGPMLGDGANVRFTESRTELGDGEVFVVHSDGLVRAADRQGRSFGDHRMQQVLRRQKLTAPAEVRSEILAALAAFRDGAPLTDDAAFVVVRVS